MKLINDICPADAFMDSQMMCLNVLFNVCWLHCSMKSWTVHRRLLSVSVLRLKFLLGKTKESKEKWSKSSDTETGSS